jgi:hypothetical protein
MELKNVNLNSNNVVASNENKVNIFFVLIVKIGFENKHHMLCFLQDGPLPLKQNSSYCSPH